MFYLKYSKQFKKDLKRLRNYKKLLLELEKVLDLLIVGKKLPDKYRECSLKGNFKDCLECHLKANLLLIYKKEQDHFLIMLLRIGSHSELF